MLKSEKLFGKSSDAAEARPLPATVRAAVTPALAPGDRPAAAGVVRPAPMHPTVVSRVVPASIANAANFSNSAETRSKLMVGPNIRMRGVEITDCDTLIVEGRVEATIDARVIQITEPGAYIGNGEFDVAEIRGQFDGELTVRQKLVVYGTGRVTGKVRYGKLVIEEGGQVTGDVQLSNPAAKGLTVAAG